MAKFCFTKKTIGILGSVGTILIILFGSQFQTQAQTIRYQQNIRGGFAIAANALSLSPPGISAKWAKTDGGTTTSSYSDLVLPAGSTIVKAFLYIEKYYSSNPISSVK